MMIADAAGALGGFGILLLLLLALVVGVVWLVFPFVVWGGFTNLSKLLEKQNERLGQIATRQNETNKALQWIVDNWNARP